MTERDHRRDAAVFRSVDGLLVVGMFLEPGREANVRKLIDDARTVGADAVWVHGAVVDASLGFREVGGFARLQAAAIPPALELASPPRERVRELQRVCFSGVWGRREPGSVDPAAAFVGLFEAGQWTGICEVRGDDGWIDGPGVLPMLRAPERSARLVRGAAAHVTHAPVTLETWGDDDETIAAYCELGFEVVEAVPAWELRLR